MPAQDDEAFVREQYADERSLAARKRVYRNAEGPDPRELLWAAVAEVSPRRLLEVGGGEGEFAERVVRELACDVVGIDQSARMVEIQRAKGLDARVGDVQSLPFPDASFDVAVAAWMLYHVPDLDRALAELARVLQPGGRLVAVTNGSDHLLELHTLAGRPHRPPSFRRENGEAELRRHFARVERFDVDGWLTMDDAAMRSYAASWSELAPILSLPPQESLRIRRRPTIFVATR